MTETEEQALSEAKAILRLHFDSFVITTRISDFDGSDRVNSDWHGSISDIIGLNRVTALRLDAVALDKIKLE